MCVVSLGIDLLSFDVIVVGLTGVGEALLS